MSAKKFLLSQMLSSILLRYLRSVMLFFDMDTSACQIASDLCDFVCRRLACGFERLVLDSDKPTIDRFNYCDLF